MSLNTAQIIGRLGQNPELRYTRSDTAVCNLSIATSRKYDGEEHTEWHRVVVFGNTAEACAEYLDKGSQVYVEGRLQTNEWEDRDGNKRQTTEIVAEKVDFLGGSSGGGGSRGPAPGGGAPSGSFDDDEVPF